MVDPHNPTTNQVNFFMDHVLEEPGTILSVKMQKNEPRGFAVNIRGPFRLVPYMFATPETVIDATWAGEPESKSHLHLCWSEVKFAQLIETNQAVRNNIHYEWELAFFTCETDALCQDRSRHRLFWFYLKDHHHKAVQNLLSQKDQLVALMDYQSK